MSDTEFDPFEEDQQSEEGAEGQEAEGAEQQAEGAEQSEQQGAEQEEGSESQGENTEEPPNSEEDKSKTTEKMIPESRLKAALKDVNEKLEKITAENMQLKAKPAPDPNTDPDGYALHNRIEISKQIMRDAVPDYNEKIAHYQEMAALNPLLNEAVKAAANPAKYAYDIAKKDMEIREVVEARGSDEWKQFQEWKKNGGKQPIKNADVAEQLRTPGKSPASQVPNLNRATNTNNSKAKSEDDDYLFADSKF